jgi:hypothetical protein
MTQDDQIQNTVRIGEGNKEIIQFAKNWCGHIEVERWGGTGLVEIQTGLPIGARMFKCPHARAGGLAGMDLQTVALDFYDRNCFDCKERVPVRFPNLSGIVAERDTDRQRQANAQAQVKEALARALTSRAAARRELSKGSDPARIGVFAIIEAFDSDFEDQAYRTREAGRCDSAHGIVVREQVNSGSVNPAKASIPSQRKVANACFVGGRSA